MCEEREDFLVGTVAREREVGEFSLVSLHMSTERRLGLSLEACRTKHSPSVSCSVFFFSPSPLSIQSSPSSLLRSKPSSAFSLRAHGLPPSRTRRHLPLPTSFLFLHLITPGSLTQPSILNPLTPFNPIIPTVFFAKAGGRPPPALYPKMFKT